MKDKINILLNNNYENENIITSLNLLVEEYNNNSDNKTLIKKLFILAVKYESLTLIRNLLKFNIDVFLSPMHLKCSDNFEYKFMKLLCKNSTLKLSIVGNMNTNTKIYILNHNIYPILEL